MQNKSGIKPLGRAVLVKPYEPEKASSIIELPDFVKERDVMIEQRAQIVDLGPLAWHTEPVPRAKIGDKVMVSKFAGVLVQGTADGEQYRLINDNDIFAAIEVE